MLFIFNLNPVKSNLTEPNAKRIMLREYRQISKQHAMMIEMQIASLKLDNQELSLDIDDLKLQLSMLKTLHQLQCKNPIPDFPKETSQQ